MNRSDNPANPNPLSPEALKSVAEELAGIRFSDYELELCSNRLGGLLYSIQELEKLDLEDQAPLYSILPPKEEDEMMSSFQELEALDLGDQAPHYNILIPEEN